MTGAPGGMNPVRCRSIHRLDGDTARRLPAAARSHIVRYGTPRGDE